MPVDSQHTQYSAAHSSWKTMCDVLAGEDAVKAMGDLYLSKLDDQTPENYESYKKRAQFFNATARTLQTLCGYVFRKDPVIEAPGMDEFVGDVSLGGTSMLEYAKDTVRDVMGYGRRGTLVDWSDEEGRAFAVPYTATSIINWKSERLNGRMTLTMLMLHEKSEKYIAMEGADKAEAPDEYENKSWDQWREYRLVADGSGTYFVVCKIWRRKNRKATETSGAQEFVMVDEIIPNRRGRGLPMIPFIFHNAENGLPDVGRVPLYDMALVNLSLYRTSADLENGRHITGVPTPYAAGFSIPEGEKLLLGSNVAYQSDNPQAKIAYAEFNGQGLGALETGMTQKKAEMIALGAKMLEPEAKKAEAYETVAARQAAETSALMNLTVSCTETLSDVLQLALWWSSTEADPSAFDEKANIELNTEFTMGRLPSDQLTALFSAYGSGYISDTVLFYNLTQSEIIPTGYTAEEMASDIAARPPAMMAPAEPEPEPEPGDA